MKKILGLDIGTTSIGWAIVEATDKKPAKFNEYVKDDLPETKTDTNNLRTAIHKGEDGLPAVGVRIIPQGDIGQRFDSGKKLNDGKKKTPTAERRVHRSARKTKSRYKLRRDKLCTVLEILEMLPDDSYEKIINRNSKEIWKPIESKSNKWYTNKREYEHDEFGIKKKKRNIDIGEQLYKLRTDALSKENEIDLKDWGRILLHLNQWRGYSSDRFSSSEEDLDNDYHSGTVTYITDEPIKIEYEENDSEKIKWKQYQVEIEFDKPIIVEDKNEDEIREVTLTSIKGNLYVKELKFEKDDLITFSFERLKNETKIKFIKPKPESPGYWKYKYFLLNKDLKGWCKDGGTVGSYFYNHHSTFNKAKENAYETTNKILNERIRNIVVNRKWYEDEFDKIWNVQFEKQKEHITPELIEKCLDAAFTKDVKIKQELQKIIKPELQLKTLIRDKIIYYQRSWQQSKNKGECRFEKIPDIKKDKDGKVIPHKDGKEHWKGRTVIPRSHPLHQEFKIWQQINNVRLWYHCPEGKFELFTESEFNNYCSVKLESIDVKEKLYECLQENKSKSWRTFISDYIKIKIDESKTIIDKDIPVLIIEDKKKQHRRDKNKTEIIYDKFYTVNFVKLNKKKEPQDNPLKGNTTKYQIREVLSDKTNKWYAEVAKKGIDKHNSQKVNIDGKPVAIFNYKTNEYQVTNLQLIWEIVYDITGFQAGNEKANIEMITKKIRNHFNIETITDKQCALLAKIKFDDSGMGNLSAKAIRKLLPLMADGKYALQYTMPEKVKAQVNKLVELNQHEQNEINDEAKLYSLKDFITDKKARIKLSGKMSADEFKGLNYWETAAVVYGNHSKAGITNISTDEIKERIKNLQTVKPGSMNNPVVEKIVNETLKMVQLIYQTYGFDELRIELSRELKNSREEREAIWEAQNNNKQKNDFAKKMLREMFNGEDISQLDLSISSSNIEKIKIIEDVVSNLKPIEHTEKRKEYKISEPTKADVIKYRLWLDQEFKCPYTNRNIPFTDVFAKVKKVEIEHIIPKERYFDNSYTNKVITWVEVNAEKAKYGNRTAYEFIVSKRNGINSVKFRNENFDLVPPYKWEEHVTKMFGKGRKAKNLLRKSITEDPINRELKETQYINKKLREKLGEVMGFDKVWTTTGQITDMLRNAWHLNDKVMQELVKERYEKFKPPMGKGTSLESIPEYKIIYKSTIINKNTGKEKEIDIFPNFSKRLDHRHHALDAIIVACTTQMHIQNINTLNAKFDLRNYKGDDGNEIAKKKKYNTIDEIITQLNEEGKRTFKEPWNTDLFIPAVKNALQNIIISHKNSNVLVSPSKNKQIDINNYQPSISIRKKLHQETLVGKRTIYDNNLIPIEDIIERIIEKKRYSEKSLAEIITSIVFKEKFQKLLLLLFEEYSSITDMDTLKSTLIQKISINKSNYFEAATTLKEIPIKRGNESVGSINNNKVIDVRTKRHLQYRQDWIKQVDDEWKKYKNEKESDEKRVVEQKKKLVNNFTDSPIYYNALYDVRMKDGTWKPLFESDTSIIEDIEYIKYKKGEKKTDNKRTELIKKTIKEYPFKFNKENILLEHPIFTDEKNKIVIKRTTAENWVGNDSLIEIRPKTFVATEGKFRVIVTESIDDIKEKHFKFIDHLTALQFQKCEKDFVKAEIKIPNKHIRIGDKFLFTLSKNDLVYIPLEVNGVQDWNSIKSLSDNLYLVSSFDEKNQYIILQKHSVAEPIKMNDIYDSRGLQKKLLQLQEELEREKNEFLRQSEVIKPIKNEIEQLKESNKKADINKEDKRVNIVRIKELQEKISQDELLLKDHKSEIEKKEKTVSKLQIVIAFKPKDDKPSPSIEESTEIKYDGKKKGIIKVFSDKLGKKIVPYWEFTNGCWNKKRAKELALVI